eukprot:Lankesteria_metandrocarpae@DN10732_c0_g1_i1.p1
MVTTSVTATAYDGTDNPTNATDAFPTDEWLPWGEFGNYQGENLDVKPEARNNPSLPENVSLVNLPLTWGDVSEAVLSGRPQCLQRLPGANREFIEWSKSLKEKYVSLKHHILVKYWGFEAHTDTETGKLATDPEDELKLKVHQRRLIVRNGFPYEFVEGIEHWVLWSLDSMTADETHPLVEARFPHNKYDRIVFVQLTNFRSFPAFFHAHIVVRVKP